MYTEFEATILDINVKALRRKLKDVGAKLIYPERLMRRYIFAPFQKDKIHGTWVRVRDEGDKITMSLKVVSGKKIEDQKEICLTIDSFEEGYDFFETSWFETKSVSRNKKKILDAR
ncbi:MAG: hypothetical protein UT32_C0021G0004 [Parcubacteria group bacterium GW2011_GWC2_39_14]|nr:MAG: hypothetical protein UT32_C0021G0004 [Parcubacteria group bacterium GW2011_GWC2_39_14]KKR53937.1 MAG: hypothetical protein UT91_C0022G0004 [Parcubacteria group bacterium GW2011_GWA2_40_23]